MGELALVGIVTFQPRRSMEFVMLVCDVVDAIPALLIGVTLSSPRHDFLSRSFSREFFSSSST